MVFMDGDFEKYPSDPYMIRYLIDKNTLDNFYVTIPVVLRNDLLDIILDEANPDNDNRVISFTLKHTGDEERGTYISNLIYYNNPLIEHDHRLEELLLGYRLQDIISGKFYELSSKMDRYVFYDPDKNIISQDMLTLLSVRLKNLWDNYTDKKFDFEKYFSIEIFSLQETGVGFQAEGYGYNIVNMMLKIKYKEIYNRYMMEKILKLALTRIIMLNYSVVDSLLAIYYQNLQYNNNKNFVNAVWLRNHMRMYMKSEFNDMDIDPEEKGLRCSIEVMRYITQDLSQNEIIALEIYNQLIVDSETEETIFGKRLEIKPWSLKRYNRYIITPMSFTDSTMVNCDGEVMYINAAMEPIDSEEPSFMTEAKTLVQAIPELRLIYDKEWELIPVGYSISTYEGTEHKEVAERSMKTFLEKNNLPEEFKEMFEFDPSIFEFSKFMEYLDIRLMDYIDILPKDIYEDIYYDYNKISDTKGNGEFVIDFMNKIIESYDK